MLHFRSNKKFVWVPDSTEADGSGLHDLLSKLPDEGLLLAEIKETNGYMQVEVPCQLMRDLLDKIQSAGGSSLPVEETSQVLTALAERRQGRIIAWMQENLQHIATEGDAQRLMMQTKTVLARRGRFSGFRVFCSQFEWELSENSKVSLQESCEVAAAATLVQPHMPAVQAALRVANGSWRRGT